MNQKDHLALNIGLTEVSTMLQTVLNSTLI